MIITDKFCLEIWDNDEETALLNEGVINFFNKAGLKIYYAQTNPYELLKLDYKKFLGDYINSFHTKICSGDWDTFRAAYGIKYLADELLINTIKSPVCLFYNGEKFILSKGNKKLLASALISEFKHPTIIVSNQAIENSILINNDDELYSILYNLDNAKQFYIRIEKFNYGYSFHFMVNNSNINNWVNPLKCATFYNSNLIHQPLTIGLLGYAESDIKDNDVIKLEKKLTCLASFDLIHAEQVKQFNNYFCTVYCNVPKNITLEYLKFVRLNLYMKSKIRIGYTNSLTDIFENDILIKFNAVDGITSKIPNYD
jgi:hypothetical protein